MHVSYVAIGKQIALGSWGREYQSMTRAVEAQDKDGNMMCLLAAAVDILDDIKRRLAIEKKEVIPEPDLTEGYLLGILSLTEQIKTIANSDTSRLSVRATNILEGQVDPKTKLSELTEDFLLFLRNCGKTTTLEIMQWAKDEMRKVVNDEQAGQEASCDVVSNTETVSN